MKTNDKVFFAVDVMMKSKGRVSQTSIANKPRRALLGTCAYTCTSRKRLDRRQRRPEAQSKNLINFGITPDVVLTFSDVKRATKYFQSNGTIPRWPFSSKQLSVVRWFISNPKRELGTRDVYVGLSRVIAHVRKNKATFWSDASIEAKKVFPRGYLFYLANCPDQRWEKVKIAVAWWNFLWVLTSSSQLISSTLKWISPNNVKKTIKHWYSSTIHDFVYLVTSIEYFTTMLNFSLLVTWISTVSMATLTFNSFLTPFRG